MAGPVSTESLIRCQSLPQVPVSATTRFPGEDELHYQASQLKFVTKFFLSPDGKRFKSLQSARAWNSVIVRNPNNNRTELPENSKRRRKNMVKLDKAKSEARIAKFVEKKRRELLFPQFS